MKLLIKYAGKRNRVIIDATPDSLVGDIKKEIESKFRLNFIGFRLIFTIFSNFEVLLTDSFKLSFFGITQGSIIEVEAYGYKKLSNRKKSRNSTYLENIGIPIKYLYTDRTVFDNIIYLCKKGDLGEFIATSEKYIQSNPEDDLLNQTHSNCWSLMHYASYYGRHGILNYLVSKQVNVNKVTVDKWTPLQLACFMGHIESVVSLMKHKNLQINKMTKFRGTPLHLSCENDFTEIVKILLDNGAFVPLKDLYGRTPFDLTCEQEILNMLAVAMGIQVLKKFSESKPEEFETKVWLTGTFFIHDRYVILSLDPEKGYLHRYDIQTYEDKGKPELSIKLVDIQDVREETNWLFSHKQEYYFVVETSKSTSKYYTKSLEFTLEWIQRIKKAVDYFLLQGPNRNEEESVHEEVAEDQPAVCESSTSHQENINSDCFKIIEELGNGSFGTVYKVVKTDDENAVFAMKTLNKSFLIKHKHLKYAISEVKIMNTIKHPFILNLFYAFQTHTNIYMILDYCPNGDLLDLISEKGKLDDQAARFYLAEVILALEYLHSLDIIYRDLKPANILLDKEGHIKLADFGLAKENVNNQNPAKTLAGTPAYLPPETLTQTGTSKPADIYGLGPLLYEMLTGLPPYYSRNVDQIYNNIKQGHLSFPPFVSDLAQNFVKQVMKKAPEKRPTINNIKRSPFFRKLDWDALLAKKIRPPQLIRSRTRKDLLDYEFKVGI
jgi:Protein kinase domain/Ankyrin repeats (many copies)/Ankyrin repeat